MSMHMEGSIHMGQDGNINVATYRRIDAYTSIPHTHAHTYICMLIITFSYTCMAHIHTINTNIY